MICRVTTNRLQVQQLPDGRLHLHDGPIDLIVGAFGAKAQVEESYGAAVHRFTTVLDELCAELPQLRERSRAGVSRLNGVIARRMEQAVAPFADEGFITPMAAVAGAVAEEILRAMTFAAELDRAYVNNGGDIALHLAGSASFAVGMIEGPDRPSLFGSLTVHADDPMRGIATSGWRGRSFSLGIADAVTVLADHAAQADAAATIIANAVDLPGHPAITRIPARELAPDTDLGDTLVTQNVGALTPHEIDAALKGGAGRARALLDRGLICAAALRLQGETVVAGIDAAPAIMSVHQTNRSLVHA
jgi:ApbE superfamily uncharacterized protein (UPF0280 family)